MTSCQFNATLGGIGDFVVASATAGHATPENSNVTDGKTYTYYAQSIDPVTLLPDGLYWEAGSGAYIIATHKLLRTTIVATSNGDLLPVNFPFMPIVDVYASSSGSLEVPPPAIIKTGTPTIGQIAQWTDATHIQGVSLLAIASGALGSDVALNNISNYFDGPSMAQGTLGTWFVSGTVTLIDTGGAASFFAKLWDGTTVIASSALTVSAANFRGSITLSGIIVSPVANVKISVNDAVLTTGLIKFNSSGNSLDSRIWGIRIA